MSQNYSVIKDIILDDIEPDIKTEEVLEKIEKMIIYVDLLDMTTCRFIKEAAAEILDILDGPYQIHKYGKIYADFTIFRDGDPDKVPIVKIGKHKSAHSPLVTSIQNRNGNKNFEFILPIGTGWSCRYDMIVRSFIRKISKAITEREEFISQHGHEAVQELDENHRARIDLVTKMMAYGVLAHTNKDKLITKGNINLYFQSRSFANKASFVTDDEFNNWPKLSSEAYKKWLDDLPIMVGLTAVIYGVVDINPKVLEMGVTSELIKSVSDNPMDIISLHSKLPPIEGNLFNS